MLNEFAARAAMRAPDACGLPRLGNESGAAALRFAAGICALLLVACGGAPATVPSEAATVPSWGEASKVADAGEVSRLLYGGDDPPLVRMEVLPDGTAFAVWTRSSPTAAVVASRFDGSTWSPLTERTASRVVRPWLTASDAGVAAIAFGEEAAYRSGYLPWVIRYQPGTGFRPAERLQSEPSFFEWCCTIGANPPSPSMKPGAVMDDRGNVQVLWNRMYPLASRPGITSATDVYSATSTTSSSWGQDEFLTLDEQIDFLRVSRTRAAVVWMPRNNLRYRIQFFDASGGWRSAGSVDGYFTAMVPAREGAVAVVGGYAEQSMRLRGFDLQGNAGPVETVSLPGQDGPPALCGNERGALAIVVGQAGAITLRYRAPGASPPSFATTTISAPARSFRDPLACHIDARDRVLTLWKEGASTLAVRYLPESGLEGAQTIGPALGVTPALGEDRLGQVSAIWSTVAADRTVQIWWNRLGGS